MKWERDGGGIRKDLEPGLKLVMPEAQPRHMSERCLRGHQVQQTNETVYKKH